MTDKPPSPPSTYPPGFVSPGDPVVRCACGTLLHRYRNLTQCQDCEDLAARQSDDPAPSERD